MPASRASWVDRKLTCSPLTLMVPRSGIIAPERHLIRVDLPAPLSPMTASTSPGNSRRSTPRRPTTRPNSLTIPSASRIGWWVPSLAGAGAVDVSVMPGPLGTVGGREALHLVRCSCPDAPDPLVDGDREDHQDAGGEHLVVGVDAREREPAVEDLH